MLCVHSVAERVLSHVRRDELLSPGDRVGVAVSGGIDSVALLRLLLEVRRELGVVLSVIHFNHTLRGKESDADEQFVAALAREYDLEFLCDRGDVARHAAEGRVSIEAAARELRYAFFHRLLGVNGPEGLVPDPHDPSLRGREEPLFHSSDEVAWKKSEDTASQSSERGLLRSSPSQHLHKIVTGHTLDDQAETVLLRAIRGAGLRGIAGIYPNISVEDDDGNFCGEMVRPLLNTRRHHLEQYLAAIGQSWREDATNTSTKFTRNRVRKLVLPLLEKEFNPSVTENLAELAEIARGEEDFWQNEVAGWMGAGVHWSEPAWASRSDLVQIGAAGTGVSSNRSVQPQRSDLEAKIEGVPWLVMNASVDRLWFTGEPLAVQRRVIKAIGGEAGIPLEFKHIEKIVRFATHHAGSGTELSLPMGWKLTLEPDQILFLTPDLREGGVDHDYEYELTIPGELNIPEIGVTLEARRVPPKAGYNPEHLLDGDSLASCLKVRNWRAGDRFWPNHTKAPRKVKELLQERHVPHAERKLWPVIVNGDDIVWMRGFPVPARYAAKPGRDAIVVELPTDSER
jgi:tRNA(Ile)-lysidine synthase